MDESSYYDLQCTRCRYASRSTGRTGGILPGAPHYCGGTFAKRLPFARALSVTSEAGVMIAEQRGPYDSSIVRVTTAEEARRVIDALHAQFLTELVPQSVAQARQAVLDHMPACPDKACLACANNRAEVDALIVATIVAADGLVTRKRMSAIGDALITLRAEAKKEGCANLTDAFGITSRDAWRALYDLLAALDKALPVTPDDQQAIDDECVT